LDCGGIKIVDKTNLVLILCDGLRLPLLVLAELKEEVVVRELVILPKELLNTFVKGGVNGVLKILRLDERSDLVEEIKITLGEVENASLNVV
jgi:hypothetical protein